MSASRSILIVEDEPLIAMMLEDFLESLGHSICASCDSVSSAMAEVEKGGFDLAKQIIEAGDTLLDSRDALAGVDRRAQPRHVFFGAREEGRVACAQRRLNRLEAVEIGRQGQRLGLVLVAGAIGVETLLKTFASKAEA